MSFVVLDTDVASASFLGRLPDRLHTSLATKTPCMTFVTLGELTKWTAIRSWGPQRRAALATWRRHVTVLKYDERVATTWDDLQARAQLRGRPRPVNDTWIAACCLAEGLPLATFNTKDFADFATYDGLQLVDVT
ncbi:type II toxin-antitoxin system VapC family toxin [Phytohabitans suffuscus]|nr:type II toxin-antitoxin system VapC family toxin [Phytohabitans suffuscus]